MCLYTFHKWSDTKIFFFENNSSIFRRKRKLHLNLLINLNGVSWGWYLITHQSLENCFFYSQYKIYVTDPVVYIISKELCDTYLSSYLFILMVQERVTKWLLSHLFLSLDKTSIFSAEKFIYDSYKICLLFSSRSQDLFITWCFIINSYRI